MRIGKANRLKLKMGSSIEYKGAESVHPFIQQLAEDIRDRYDGEILVKKWLTSMPDFINPSRTTIILNDILGMVFEHTEDAGNLDHIDPEFGSFTVAIEGEAANALQTFPRGSTTQVEAWIFEKLDEIMSKYYGWDRTD